jgi:hypothetical protein
MIQRLDRANAIGYAKLFKRIHDAVIRVFEGISLAPQSLALSTHHRTTEYDFDHSVHFVHSVEKFCRKNCLFANLALAPDDVLISR